jgi:predicted MPP superfamily phosphohydrolase
MITRRGFLRFLGTLGLSGIALAAYGIFFEPFRGPKITRYEVRPGLWPAGLKLKIAAIADIHACDPWMTAQHIQSIVNTTNDLGADLIVLLGDYSAGHRFVTDTVHSDDWSAALGRLKAPLGVHAILGNHDWWDDKAVQVAGAGPTYGRRALERVGIPVYENDAVRLSKDGQPFWLAGLGDQLAGAVLPAAKWASTIFAPRWPRSPNLKQSSCWLTSQTSWSACPNGWRWC